MSRIRILFLLFLLPLLVSGKPDQCSSPPVWSFYDIVSHLATINVTDPNLNVTTFTNGLTTTSTILTNTADSSLSSSPSTIQYRPPPIQFLYNENTTML